MKSRSYTNQLPDKKPSDLNNKETLSLLKKFFLDSASRSPQVKMPEVKPDLNTFLEFSPDLKFIWFGHSTFLLSLGGQRILVDPVFHSASPFSFMVKRFQAPVLKLNELPVVDIILISHDHYDHLDKKTVKFFRKKKAHFIVPTGVSKHLRKWGIPLERITEVAWDESFDKNGLTFTAAPAQHFSGRTPFDRNETLWAAWIVQSQNQKIYYSGDSGYGPHFKQTGEKHGPFDYAFIENGQYNVRWPDVHMQPEESLQALIDLEAHTMIPVHWGMFDLSLHHWSEPIIRTHKIAKAWGLSLITPRLGEVVTRDHQPDSPWWEEMVSETEKEVVPLPPFAPELATK